MNDELRRGIQYALLYCLPFIVHNSSFIVSSLEVGEPVVILTVLAFGDGEEVLLESTGDFTGYSAANVTVVHFTDRGHFGGSASKERLVGQVYLITGNAIFRQRVSHVVEESDDRIAGNAR